MKSVSLVVAYSSMLFPKLFHSPALPGAPSIAYHLSVDWHHSKRCVYLFCKVFMFQNSVPQFLIFKHLEGFYFCLVIHSYLLFYILKPLTIVGDLSKEGDVERIIDTTVKNFGQIDILVSYLFAISKCTLWYWYYLRIGNTIKMFSVSKVFSLLQTHEWKLCILGE